MLRSRLRVSRSMALDRVGLDVSQILQGYRSPRWSSEPETRAGKLESSWPARDCLGHRYTIPRLFRVMLRARIAGRPSQLQGFPARIPEPGGPNRRQMNAANQFESPAGGGAVLQRAKKAEGPVPDSPELLASHQASDTLAPMLFSRYASPSRFPSDRTVSSAGRYWPRRLATPRFAIGGCPDCWPLRRLRSGIRIPSRCGRPSSD